MQGFILGLVEGGGCKGGEWGVFDDWEMRNKILKNKTKKVLSN